MPTYQDIANLILFLKVLGAVALILVFAWWVMDNVIDPWLSARLAKRWNRRPNVVVGRFGGVR